MIDELSEEKKNIVLEAAMKKFDWAIGQNKDVLAKPDSYRNLGLSETQMVTVKTAHDKLFGDQLDSIKEVVKKDLEALIKKTKPCPEGKKYRRVMFAGPHGSEAPELMVACQQENGIENQNIPDEVKRLLSDTKEGLVVDMDVLRSKVPGFKDFFDKDPETASSIVRPIVSAWVHAYYELAEKANVNLWSNETMASDVYKDPIWLDKALKPYPINVIAVLPPAEERLEALQASALTLPQKTGAAIPPAQVEASLKVIQETALTNMQTYDWPGFVLTGSLDKGFETAASNTPALNTPTLKQAGRSSITIHKQQELQGFSGIPEQGQSAGTGVNLTRR